MNNNINGDDDDNDEDSHNNKTQDIISIHLHTHTHSLAHIQFIIQHLVKLAKLKYTVWLTIQRQGGHAPIEIIY